MLANVLPHLRSAQKPLVLKAFPECLPLSDPVFVDSDFPPTLIPDVFWETWGKAGSAPAATGMHVRRKRAGAFPGPISQNIGDERSILSPIGSRRLAQTAGGRREARINEAMKETIIRPEYTTEADIFFNYALWPYKPAVPYANKFRSINLLLHSFEIAGADERMFRLVGGLREAVGASNTVWGVKRKARASGGSSISMTTGEAGDRGRSRLSSMRSNPLSQAR